MSSATSRTEPVLRWPAGKRLSGAALARHAAVGTGWQLAGLEVQHPPRIPVSLLKWLPAVSSPPAEALMSPWAPGIRPAGPPPVTRQEEIVPLVLAALDWSPGQR